MSAAFGHEAQKATTRTLILLIFLQMLGELVDSLSQKADLNVGGTRVLVVEPGFLDNYLLFLG